jgi:class 3 adenylate cyclase
MSQESAPGQASGQRGTPPDPIEPSGLPPLPTPLDAALIGETPTTPPPTADVSSDESAVPLTFGPTVTIFFSDIRGFTEYTEAHGDAAAYRMLQHHNAMVQEQIALYGGHIVKTLGDSYMVSFDAARNAMTCGIGIQKSLARYNGERTGATIDIGVGINTGEPIREAEDFFGGSVNLAARICATAGPGQILVSEAVRHVVGKMEGTEYVDRGYFELKGFHEPQRLYEVDWSGLGVSTSAPSSSATTTTPARSDGQRADGAATASARPGRRRGLLIGVVSALALLAVLGGGLLLLRERRAPSMAEEPAPKPQVGQGPGVAAKPGAASPGVAAKPAVASPAVTSPAAAAGPTSAPSPVAVASPIAVASPVAAASPAVAEVGRLLRVDDFSDPARGQFLNNQQGTARVMVNGAPVDFQWGFGYQGGAMVVRLSGTYPENSGPDQPPFGRSAPMIDKVFEDFAAEVRGHLTKSPGQGRFGFLYTPVPGDTFSFTVNPTTPGYVISHTVNQQTVQVLISRRTGLLKPADQDNVVRLEVRGDTARLFINGQQAEQVQHESLGRRGGVVGLQFLAAGRFPDGEAAVQFDDFKLFALGDR